MPAACCKAAMLSKKLAHDSYTPEITLSCNIHELCIVIVCMFKSEGGC